MKTRSKKTAVKTVKETTIENPTPKALGASVEKPPHVFVLPKRISREARIVTLPSCANKDQDRYLVCPEHGFYEFTKITGPKRAPRSWLLASNRSQSGGNQSSEQRVISQANRSDEPEEVETVEGAPQDSGYVLRSPDLLVATPIDPLFILLPAMLGSYESMGQEFLAPSDYIVALTEVAPHLQAIIRPHAPGRLEQLLERRLEATCDCVDMGDDKMYALSLPKLVQELVSKAKQMVAHGLPASMEARFITQSLDIPDFGIKRGEVSIDTVTEESTAVPDNGTTSEQESQESDHSVQSHDINGTTITTATSVSTSCDENPSSAPRDVVDLLRVRTVFDFLVTSYIPPKLHSKLHALLRDPKCSGLDFATLEQRLSHIDGVKRQAQALRTLSDNVSRKRSATEDEEATEKAEAKRRKKEEEESKKRSMSQGVKQLMKADTSGMKKLSAFFSKAPVKK